MTGKQWRMHGVTRRMQLCAEIAQRLRRIAEPVKEEYATPIRSREPESLRAFDDSVCADRESFRILLFERALYATPVERARDDCEGRQ